MRSKIVVLAVVMGVFVVNGCQSAPQRTLLAAPAGANVAAVRHNDEGIQAYQLGQWESARQRFEAAIKASPGLAEAHYNLGLAYAILDDRPSALKEHAILKELDIYLANKLFPVIPRAEGE